MIDAQRKMNAAALVEEPVGGLAGSARLVASGLSFKAHYSGDGLD